VPCRVAAWGLPTLRRGMTSGTVRRRGVARPGARRQRFGAAGATVVTLATSNPPLRTDKLRTADDT